MVMATFFLTLHITSLGRSLWPQGSPSVSQHEWYKWVKTPKVRIYYHNLTRDEEITNKEEMGYLNCDYTMKRKLGKIVEHVDE